VIVRRERPGDLDAVGEVVGSAFAGPRAGEPPVEVGLLAALRADTGWLPALSLVAERDGEVVGHVVGTRAHVDGRPAVGLGPLAVRPDRQRAGVGTALVHAVLAAAEALGEPLVGLLGDPAYYGRFGFGAAADLGVVAPEPEWGRHFQVRVLHEPLRGRFSYAAPFRDL
jgi:putative acetyltransferase